MSSETETEQETEQEIEKEPLSHIEKYPIMVWVYILAFWGLLYWWVWDM